MFLRTIFLNLIFESITDFDGNLNTFQNTLIPDYPDKDDVSRCGGEHTRCNIFIYWQLSFTSS